jgi:hypothetical protein
MVCFYILFLNKNINAKNKLKALYIFTLKTIQITILFSFCFFQPKSILAKDVHCILSNHQELLVL